MHSQYDYTLIDSRTGVSDTAGICTVQMPDILVVFFTANKQSIDGSAFVSASVQRQRSEHAGPGRPHFRIFPVLTRVDPFEKKKLDSAWQYVKTKFASFVRHVEDVEDYWGRVAAPYVPFYAYEEVLATFGDEPRQPKTLLEAMEHLTRYLTDGAVKRLRPPTVEVDRQRILAQYAWALEPPVEVDRQRILAQYAWALEPPGMHGQPEVFISFASRDGECFAEAVRVRLQRESPALGLWKDHLSLEGGRGWWDQIEAALDEARFLVLILTPAVLSEKLAPVVQKELRYARQQGVWIYPVMGAPKEQ